MPDALHLAFIAAAALLASTLAAVSGFGGAAVLLPVLVASFGLREAIPILVSGRDILGHPFNSVGWLATQLSSRGVSLKSGQVGMTGSVMKTIFPVEDATYRFDLEDIGSVEVRVA